MKHSHGNKCSCRILSIAVTGRTDACSYAYCKNVLQHHWTMSCNHRQPPSTEKPPMYEQIVEHENATLRLLKKALG